MIEVVNGVYRFLNVFTLLRQASNTFRVKNEGGDFLDELR
jgi:hypothetical protein